MRKNARSRGVTILDVAREAGVSPTTVSRVLNSRDHVRPDKRTRVLTAVTRLGYVVNQQARSLAGGRSSVIGLMIPNPSTRLLSLTAWLGMVAFHWPTWRFYGLSPLWPLLTPLIGTLYLSMTWSSALRYYRGVRSEWKGRTYR